MASKVPALTHSAVLEEVQHDDNTLHIVGYVDAIMGQQTVGRKRSLSLFKFVITNGQLKIKVLLWEDQIAVFAHLIKYNEVIEFINIKALAVDKRFNNIEPGFVDYDLSIQRATKMIFHGPMNSAGGPPPKIPEKISIKHAAAYEGVKTVEGYLCVPFVRMTTGQGTCSFSSGAVSDGSFKLRLQVANHVDTPVLVPGVHVSITGSIKTNEKSRSVFMQLEHMAEIKVIDSKILNEEQLANCYRKPLIELPTVSDDEDMGNARIESEDEDMGQERIESEADDK